VRWIKKSHADGPGKNLTAKRLNNVCDCGMTSDTAKDRNNANLRKFGMVALIGLAVVVILFVPIIPISYEEIIGHDVDEPIGRMVTKKVSIFQIITGKE